MIEEPTIPDCVCCVSHSVKHFTRAGQNGKPPRLWFQCQACGHVWIDADLSTALIRKGEMPELAKESHIRPDPDGRFDLEHFTPGIGGSREQVERSMIQGTSTGFRQLPARSRCPRASAQIGLALEELDGALELLEGESIDPSVITETLKKIGAAVHALQVADAELGSS